MAIELYDGMKLITKSSWGSEPRTVKLDKQGRFYVEDEYGRLQTYHVKKFIAHGDYIIVSTVPEPGAWLASLTSAERKKCAMSRGLFAYFPDAMAALARHSVRANAKHNPGEEVHWARDKSTDHEDCILRHSAAIAVNPDAMEDGEYEMLSRLWRAAAAAQLWIEAKHAKGEKI